MDRARHATLTLTLVAVLVGCNAAGSPSAASPSAAPASVVAASTPSARPSGVAGSGSPASPSPVVSASAKVVAPSSAATATAAYSSDRFGYSVEYPAGWAVRTATVDWPSNGFPEPDGAAVDRFGATADSEPWLFVSSVVLVDGETGAGVPVKAKDMDDVRIGDIDAELRLVCTVAETSQVTLDGVVGREQQLRQCFGTDNLIWVLVSNDVRLYLVGAFAHGPIDDATRVSFDRFIRSFRFRR